MTKTDDVNGCINPSFDGFIDSYIDYDVNYSTTCAVNDVNLIDYLPDDVNYYSSDPNGDYNSTDHTVTWNLGDLDVNDANSFTLTVRVSSSAIGGSSITNTSKMYSGETLIAIATEDTNVCCQGGSVIYVDADANDANDGSSWENAYTNLQDALAEASTGYGCKDQIWVATGTYAPSDDAGETDATFAMVEGIDMYGGFEGWETSPEQRDLADGNNASILTGDIDDNGSCDADYLVTGAADVWFDGFTVEKADVRGIYCDGSTPTIANCLIKDSDSYGIEIEDVDSGSVNIINCIVRDNDSGIRIEYVDSDWANIINCSVRNNSTLGVYCYHSVVVITDCTIESNNGGNILVSGTNANADISNCIIKDSSSYGISCGSSAEIEITNCSIANNNYGVNLSGTLLMDRCIIKDSLYDGVNGYGQYTIKNSWIFDNLSDGISSTLGPVAGSSISNTVIADNISYGIYFDGGTSADPNISNSIIWGNGGGLYGTFDEITYSCIQGGIHAGQGNDSNDPQFRNTSVDDYHLTEDSPCIDTGNPSFTADSNETDIDGEIRIMDGDSNDTEIVDMGADEFYDSPADFDGNDIVNFYDYVILADAWMTGEGDSNYNDICDLQDNNSIDFNDLALFSQDWLWEAAWPDKVMLLTEDFEDGIPVSWTVVDGYSDSKTWTTDNPYSRSSGYFTGDFCIADSMFSDMNEILITPVINCSDAIEVTLGFSHNFVKYGSEKCDVDVSVNGGAWQTVLQYTDSSTGGIITEDISALAADQSNVRIRWHYNANYDEYWGIDNIEIIGNFRLQPMQMGMGRGCTGFEKSMIAMPESYLASSSKSVSAVQEIDIKEILEWLNKIWDEDEELRKIISEDEWKKFIESLIEAYQ